MRALLRLLRALLLLMLVAAVPSQGYAALALPACAHCLPQQRGQAEAMPSDGSSHDHCLQHAHGGVKHDQCDGHCTACTSASLANALPAASTSLIALDLPSQQSIAYQPAYFYRLASPPLERPPLARSV